MLKLSDGIRSTDTADGAVLLDVRRGRIFTFNRTGSRILSLLRSGVDEREISDILVREFAADSEAANVDTAEFLALLRQHALIEHHAQPLR
jgi:Coenzyme PQQ synthesis protein D (PqqD)